MGGVLYGWKDKELYRLPQHIGQRFYPLKKVNLIDVGRKKGYLIRGKRKTINQLEEITTPINFVHQKIEDKDCPFETF